MKQRLLYITHHRLSDNNGGANASKGFLNAFGSLFDDCSIICHNISRKEPYIPTKFKFFPLQDQRTNIRKFFDMYRGAISGLYYFVREHLATHAYDVVVIDHTFSGAGLSAYIKSTGAKLVTIHHNVERDYLRDNSQERSIFYRYPFLHYSRQAERECLKYSDVNLTLTEKDAAIFRSWQIAKSIHNWGIYEYRPIADRQFTQKPKGESFIITGSLCFQQSLLPIMTFVQSYWPLLRQSYPQAKLLIAGRNPAPKLLDLCNRTAGVSIIPNPQDIGALVQKADYYICPIYTGSGLKLRILDGLREGLPILCHNVAANGYERFVGNGCMFPYHDTESFMTALHQMVDASPVPQVVYQTFRETFSPEAGQARLEAILKQEHII